MHAQTCYKFATIFMNNNNICVSVCKKIDSLKWRQYIKRRAIVTICQSMNRTARMTTISTIFGFFLLFISLKTQILCSSLKCYWIRALLTLKQKHSSHTVKFVVVYFYVCCCCCGYFFLLLYFVYISLATENQLRMQSAATCWYYSSLHSLRSLSLSLSPRTHRVALRCQF